MKKILLHTDLELKQAVEQSKEAKTRAFNELKAYIEKFVQVEDITNRYELENAFNSKYNDLPDYISLEKRMELVDFSLNKYNSLLNRYNSLELLEVETEVYATTKEQIERYNVCKSFIDAFELLEANKEGYSFYKAQIVGALGGIISFDMNNNKLIVNHNFILS